jgi:hypothetical protein
MCACVWIEFAEECIHRIRNETITHSFHSPVAWLQMITNATRPAAFMVIRIAFYTNDDVCPFGSCRRKQINDVAMLKMFMRYFATCLELNEVRLTYDSTVTLQRSLRYVANYTLKCNQRKLTSLCATVLLFITNKIYISAGISSRPTKRFRAWVGEPECVMTLITLPTSHQMH